MVYDRESREHRPGHRRELLSPMLGCALSLLSLIQGGLSSLLLDLLIFPCTENYSRPTTKQIKISSVNISWLFRIKPPQKLNQEYIYQMRAWLVTSIYVVLLVLTLRKHYTWNNCLYFTPGVIWPFYCNIYIGVFILLLFIVCVCVILMK